MKKNPFSIYDFMGYLFPGLTVLYILYYFYSCRWDLFQAIRVNVLCNTIDEIGNKFSFEKSVLIIIIAYIIGHLVSYVSSLTIEILSNRFFGYPSKYLLQKERPKYEQLWANYFKVKVDSSWKPMKIIKSTFVWIVYLFIFLILLPISLTTTTIGYLLNMNQFIIRPLDDYLISGIKTRQQELAKKSPTAPSPQTPNQRQPDMVNHGRPKPLKAVRHFNQGKNPDRSQSNFGRAEPQAERTADQHQRKTAGKAHSDHNQHTLIGINFQIIKNTHF